MTDRPDRRFSPATTDPTDGESDAQRTRGDSTEIGDLKLELQRARLGLAGPLASFYLYRVGGSGAVYGAEAVVMLREMASLGVRIDTGIVNKYRDTALHLAYVHDEVELRDFLVELGADEHAKRYNGQLPHELGPRTMTPVQFA